MDKLLDVLKAAAPALATVVAGPLGGAAVSAIAAKFGVEDSVEAVAKAIAGDPDAAAKLAEIDLKKFELHNQNTDSARRMNAEIQSAEYASWFAKNTAYVLDFVIVGATLFMTWLLFIVGVPPENKELSYMAFGSLLTLCGTVVNFHRGSSQGSKDKANEIQTLKGMIR